VRLRQVQAHEVRRRRLRQVRRRVTRARVRRERMGHIELASPVSHVWFFKGLPRASGSSSTCHCASWRRSSTSRSRGSRVEDPGHQEEGSRLGGQGAQDDGRARPRQPQGGHGAEAIRELLRDLDLDALARDLRAQMLGETSVQKRKKIVKRLKVIEAFLKSGNQPDWMILEVVPVIRPSCAHWCHWMVVASRPPTSTTSIAA